MTTTPSSGLLPCPHCGTAPTINVYYKHGPCVSCPNPKCEPVDDTTGCYYRLVEQWNRRAAGEMPVEVAIVLKNLAAAYGNHAGCTDPNCMPCEINYQITAVESLYPRAGQEEK